MKLAKHFEKYNYEKITDTKRLFYGFLLWDKTSHGRPPNDNYF